LQYLSSTGPESAEENTFSSLKGGGDLKSRAMFTEIPKRVRDDNKRKTKQFGHVEPWTDEDQAWFGICFPLYYMKRRRIER
jgi:hypothetical protein